MDQKAKADGHLGRPNNTNNHNCLPTLTRPQASDLSSLIALPRHFPLRRSTPSYLALAPKPDFYGSKTSTSHVPPTSD